MPVSLSRFKKHRSLPVVAFVSSVLLISGQLLNCCQLNESLSGMLANAFHSIGLNHSHEAGIESEAAPPSHPNCHSHGSAEMSSATGHHDVAGHEALPAESTKKQFEAHESCLSEHAFAVKARPSSPLGLIDFPVRIHKGLADDFVMTPVRIERPRPQNKAGPPLYLLTLRLLV